MRSGDASQCTMESFPHEELRGSGKCKGAGRMSVCQVYGLREGGWGLTSGFLFGEGLPQLPCLARGCSGEADGGKGF